MIFYAKRTRVYNILPIYRIENLAREKNGRNNDEKDETDEI